MVGKAMTKSETKRSSVAAIKCATAAEHVNNGPVEQSCSNPSTHVKAGVMKQTSRESLHRRNTECEVYDDGTNTFFWRAHTVTVLFILTCALVYVTLLEETPQDTTYNTKRGIVASILVFLCFGVTQAKDGPFTRPHPETHLASHMFLTHSRGKDRNEGRKEGREIRGCGGHMETDTECCSQLEA